ncbi:unnamed protein product, partial [marine sediment metagenome]
TLIKSFAAPNAVPRNMTTDGRSIYAVDSDIFYQLDMDGTIIRSAASAGSLALGIALDGRTMWVSDLDATVKQIMLN